MASTLVKSIRISPELWARVEAHAKLMGFSANQAAIWFIESGCDKSDAAVKREAPARPLREIAEETLSKAAAFKRGEPGAYTPLQRDLASAQPFRGVTASGEPLPDRKPYQKTGKK